MIVFANKPSVGVYDLSRNNLEWCHDVTDSHEIFNRLQTTKDFDYYFIDDILIIPLPNCEKIYKCSIDSVLIECHSNVLLMFHYEQLQGMIIATSLKLPEFEYIKRNLTPYLVKEI